MEYWNNGQAKDTKWYGIIGIMEWWNNGKTTKMEIECRNNGIMERSTNGMLECWNVSENKKE
jgi:hypothetical protein